MNKIDELEMKIKELSEEIERLKAEKENEVWEPEYGERYYYIAGHGYVESDTRGRNYWYDTRYAIGNVFRTQEEAEFRAEQLKVEAELRRFARPFVEGEGNFMFTYNHGRDEILTDYFEYTQYINIHFASREIAQKAIDTVGEERIKKYYFGVEE